MHTSLENCVVICTRCSHEKGRHCFTTSNNLNPGKQPNALKNLTQVEEMLITRVNPIVEVTYAHGEQYKYYGHTISFPQDIRSIVTYLP